MEGGDNTGDRGVEDLRTEAHPAKEKVEKYCGGPGKDLVLAEAIPHIRDLRSQKYRRLGVNVAALSPIEAYV